VCKLGAYLNTGIQYSQKKEKKTFERLRKDKDTLKKFGSCCGLHSATKN